MKDMRVGDLKKIISDLPDDMIVVIPIIGEDDANKIFGFRKARLNKKYGLPLTMTESEMTEKLGYIKVYDAGLIRYVWKKK